MTTLEIEIPDYIDLSPFDLKMSLAAKLYELGKISSGKGAEMVGISKSTFIQKLGEFGVSVFGYTEEELENELLDA